jgi:hypothetical protein
MGNFERLQPYTVIRLTTDRYQDQGVCLGTLGVILEVYGEEAYEVDFSDEQGNVIGWFAVEQSEVEPTDKVLVQEDEENRLLIESYLRDRDHGSNSVITLTQLKNELIADGLLWVIF